VNRILMFLMALALNIVLGQGAAFAGSCAIPANAKALAQRTLDLTNELRAQRGRDPFVMHPKLMASAQAYACEMARSGVFSHHGKNGSTAKRRLARKGCNGGFVAENLTAGPTSPAEAVQEWMNSSGHKKIMLVGRGVKYYGLGIADSGRAYTHGYLWVMVVSRRC